MTRGKELMPNLSSGTLDALASVIMGGALPRSPNGVGPYRSFDALGIFFQRAEASATWSGTVTVINRARRVRLLLEHFDGTAKLVNLLEAAVSPSEFVHKEVTVETSVAYLNDHLVLDGYRLVRDGRAYRLVVQAPAGVEVRPEMDPSKVLTDAYVREQLNKCDAKLSADDMDGAITSARTLVEAVLFAIEMRIAGTRTEHAGDLQKHYKQVARMVKLAPDQPELDDRFKDVARGLVTVVNGLAPLRNSMSDAHARSAAPAAHQATFVVNSAKTLVLFLVACFNVEVASGHLKLARRAAT